MRIGVFDTETTGVKVDSDRICEIALIMFDLDSGKTVLRYSRRIQPQMKIPAKVTAIHGIADADVMTAPTFHQVAQGIKMLFEKADVIVGHNIVSFDCPLIVAEFARVGITKLDRWPMIVDTMLEGRWATADGKVPTLGELCWALDVPYDPALAHGALYDVSCNLECFLEGLRLGLFQLPTPATAVAA